MRRIEPPIRITFEGDGATGFVIGEMMAGKHAGDFVVQLENGKRIYLEADAPGELIKDAH